jgi:hypothetical protein
MEWNIDTHRELLPRCALWDDTRVHDEIQRQECYVGWIGMKQLQPILM